MSNKDTYKPLLAITMGDPAGIGPEIAAMTFAGEELYLKCRPVLTGHRPTMEDTIRKLNLSLQINSIEDPSEARFVPGTLDLIEVGTE